MKKFTQLFWILSMVCCSSPDYYLEGNKYFQSGDYYKAILNLEKIDSTDVNFNEARNLILLSNGLIDQKRKQDKAKQDSIASAEAELILNSKIILYQSELLSIKNFDNQKYRSSLNDFTMEVGVFSAWSKMIEDGLNHTNKEINGIANKMKNSLIKLQIKEFPKIRKAYGVNADNKLWEADVDVKVYGTNNTIIEFIGGTFSANKNKQDFQNDIHSMMKILRFKQVRYKWYELDDEYTYYTIESDPDNELIVY